jgi:Skp family chaperone for outer membrane proteins
MYLCTIAVCAVLALSGASAQDKGGLKVAVVQPDRLLHEYKYNVDSLKALEQYGNDIVTQLQTWDQHRYLGEADQHAIGEIAVKESKKAELTAADKAAKARIEDASKRLFDEYLALETTQNPTPAQMQRLKEMKQLEQDTGRRIKDRQAQGKADVQKQEIDIHQKTNKDLLAGIQEIAKAKGINMVFTSEVLLYCDTDITDDVLKKLNK